MEEVATFVVAQRDGGGTAVARRASRRSCASGHTEEAAAAPRDLGCLRCGERVLRIGPNDAPEMRNCDPPRGEVLVHRRFDLNPPDRWTDRVDYHRGTRNRDGPTGTLLRRAPHRGHFSGVPSKPSIRAAGRTPDRRRAGLLDGHGSEGHWSAENRQNPGDRPDHCDNLNNRRCSKGDERRYCTHRFLDHRRRGRTHATRSFAGLATGVVAPIDDLKRFCSLPVHGQCHHSNCRESVPRNAAQPQNVRFWEGQWAARPACTRGTCFRSRCG